jgi:Family of unknown function (DUF6171)
MSSILDNAMHLLASKIIVKTKVSADITESRWAVCEKCEYRDHEKNKCKSCGCFLDLKTESETNWNPKKGRNEVTHCPNGFWNDIDTANFYRNIDGLDPLSITQK